MIHSRHRTLYAEMAALTRHDDWDTFEDWRTAEQRRLALFTTHATLPYCEFAFQDHDILLFGRESAGVPDSVHEAADARLLIPMLEGRRSLNLAVAAGIATAEALRQFR